MPKKYTNEIKDAMQKQLSVYFKEYDEKARRQKAEDLGTFDVIISTEDLDRSGEIVKQSGWDFTNYKNNPIVLWGHDYYSLPIGVCTNIQIEGNKTRAQGFFLPAEINPLAQQVRALYELGTQQGMGVGCTTSVGFIPKEFDQNNSSIITRSELLEFSFVPIPANQGVGPAQGRSVTMTEARTLGLDVEALVTKGIIFKGGEVGDTCEMEDGTPGVIGSGSNGELVCQPSEQKAATEVANNGTAQKTLKKAVNEEHSRHTGAVTDCLKAFKEKSAQVIEDQPDMNDEKATKAKADGMADCVKGLRDALAAEHDMHRAANVKSFQAFELTDEKKAFDKEPHLKALGEAHDAYGDKSTKSLDKFDKGVTGNDDGDEDDAAQHFDWIIGKMAGHAADHIEAVQKCAKAMGKAFGEGEVTNDDKTIDIIETKSGAAISAATKEKLGEAHQHLIAAKAVIEALQGLGDGSGEEKPAEDDKGIVEAPAKQRSEPAKLASAKELEAHLFARDILRGITTAATSGLETINDRLKAAAKNPR